MDRQDNRDGRWWLKVMLANETVPMMEARVSLERVMVTSTNKVPHEAWFCQWNAFTLRSAAKLESNQCCFPMSADPINPKPLEWFCLAGEDGIGEDITASCRCCCSNCSPYCYFSYIR